MAQYTVEAFKWTGTGYNAQYNTSYKATFNDNDNQYQGAGDSDESISIDGGAFSGTAGSPYVIKVPFKDVSGDSHVEEFSFFNTGGDWYFTPGPGSNFTVGAKLGFYQGHTTGWNYSDVACFADGTLISTTHGPTKVQDLAVGMAIPTIDGAAKTLHLLLRRKYSAAQLCEFPNLRPVRISAGSLGAGLPNRDLRVSRQHRMQVSSAIAQRMFGKPDVLVSAIALCRLPGIFVEETPCDIEYFHLVFDQHAVILAEGAPSESLFPGPQALKSWPKETRQEILTLFPEVGSLGFDPQPANLIPPAKLQKQLIARHAKNTKPVIINPTP